MRSGYAYNMDRLDSSLFRLLILASVMVIVFSEDGHYLYQIAPGVSQNCSCTALSESPQCSASGQCPCRDIHGEDPKLAGRRCNWYINDIHPRYGPVAGGTRVTIEGGYFSQGNLSATLGSKKTSLTVHENSASFVTEEAPGDKSHSEDLVMSLDAYEGSVGPEDIILPFEYRPNPILEDIQPRRAFLHGGFLLTVTGKHMDSVANPEMIIYVTQYDEIVRPFTSVCSVINSTTMVCPTPDINNVTEAVLENRTVDQQPAESKSAATSKTTLQPLPRFSETFPTSIGLPTAGSTKSTSSTTVTASLNTATSLDQLSTDISDVSMGELMTTTPHNVSMTNFEFTEVPLTTPIELSEIVTLSKSFPEDTLNTTISTTQIPTEVPITTPIEFIDATSSSFLLDILNATSFSTEEISSSIQTNSSAKPKTNASSSIPIAEVTQVTNQTKPTTTTNSPALSTTVPTREVSSTYSETMEIMTTTTGSKTSKVTITTPTTATYTTAVAPISTSAHIRTTVSTASIPTSQIFPTTTLPTTTTKVNTTVAPTKSSLTNTYTSVTKTTSAILATTITKALETNSNLPNTTVPSFAATSRRSPTSSASIMSITPTITLPTTYTSTTTRPTTATVRMVGITAEPTSTQLSDTMTSALPTPTPLPTTTTSTTTKPKTITTKLATTTSITTPTTKPMTTAADPSVQALNGLNGIGYTLGFWYDGFDEYIFLKNHSNPRLRNLAQLNVFRDPKINTFQETLGTDVLEYDTSKDTIIKIKGEGLNWDADQWVVEIGKGECQVISVFSNQITCKPPSEIPEIDKAVDFTTHRGVDIPHIVVKIGNVRPTVVGFVYFNKASNVGLLAALISLIILVLIIVAIAILVKWRARHQHSQIVDCNAFELSAKYVKTSSNEAVAVIVPVLQKQIDENIQAIVDRCCIPRNMLNISQKLGGGNFGLIYKAQLTTPSGNLRSVAVKSLKDDKKRSIEEIEGFLAEGTLMIDFKHENVLSLVGVVYEQGDRPLVVLPYMENGDLCTFIRRDDLELSLGDLLHFAYQISNGMEYLASQRCIHRDLAARNCMTDGSYIVKVADFGMSRDIYEKDYYVTDNMNKPLPIKWMSVESLREGRYTSKSDVWSYGVTAWELLTRGGLPYPDVENFHVKEYVFSGRRLDRPELCPPIIYEVMMRCWEENADSRPSFTEISRFLNMILTEETSPKADPSKEGCYSYTRAITRDIPHGYQSAQAGRESYIVPADNHEQTITTHCSDDELYVDNMIVDIV